MTEIILMIVIQFILFSGLIAFIIFSGKRFFKEDITFYQIVMIAMLLGILVKLSKVISLLEAM